MAAANSDALQIQIAHQAEPHSAPVTSLAGQTHIEIDDVRTAASGHRRALRDPADIASDKLITIQRKAVTPRQPGARRRAGLAQTHRKATISVAT